MINLQDASAESVAVIAGITARLPFLHTDVGADPRTVPTKLLDTVSVKDFGADPTGVLDSTAAIQSAVSLPNRLVLFPKGVYLVTSTIAISAQRIHMRGEGMHASQILFAPTINDDVCFHITNGAQVYFQGSITDLHFHSYDITRKKTALKVMDTSGYLVENISIGGAYSNGLANYWGGADSIGLQTNGREFGLFRNLYIYAERPIVISANPNSTLHCDHFHFNDVYLGASDNPCVTIENGVNVSGLVFDGAQAWVGGTYGLYYNCLTAAEVSFGLKFQNVRTEQGESSTAHQFYISHNYNLMDVSFESCHGGIERNGYYLRGVSNASLDSCKYVGSSRVALDAVAPIGGSVSIRNTSFQVGCTASLSGYRQVWASPIYAANVPIPPDAIYAYQASTITDYALIDGVKQRSFSGTLESNGELNLYCGAAYGTSLVLVTVAAKGPTKSAAGQSMVSMAGGNGTDMLIAGSTNFAVGNTGGKFCVFSNSLTVLKNNLAESVEYVATVTCR